MKYLMITLTLLSKVEERILSHYFNIHNFFMALLGCDSFNVDSMISNVFKLQLQHTAFRQRQVSSPQVLTGCFLVHLIVL